MKNFKFKFDGRLKEDELLLLKDCVNKKLRSLHFERVAINVVPNLMFSSIGRCCLSFYNEYPKDPIINIAFKSLHYEELKLPIGCRSAIQLKKSINTWKPLREKMLDLSSDIPETFTCSLMYPNESPVVSIKLYGYHQWGKLNEFKSMLDLNEIINETCFEDFTDIEIDSIEFIVIEHKDGLKTILTLQNSGFEVEMLKPDNVEQDFINRYDHPAYIIIQGGVY